MRIGVDVGGTNTDAALLDGRTVLAAAKRPTTPDVTGGIVAALGALLDARPEARPKAERSPTTWQPQPVAIYGLTIRPRIELAGIEVFPPGRDDGEYIPYWSVVLSDEDGSMLHMAMSEETALRIAALGMRELGRDSFESLP